MQHMQLAEFFDLVEQRVNDCLKNKLASLPESPRELKEAMEYALLSGGKRARPFLVYATGHAYGAPYKALDAVAAAVECIHAYSLIHDDMPEMDNDLLRRGQPTVHAKFGTATALLAGDTLQALAFEFLTDNHRLSGKTQAKMCAALARAAGFSGMCGGQALDLAAEHQTLSQDELQHLHELKTGALITCAIQLGYLVGQNDLTSESGFNDSVSKAMGLVESWSSARDFEALSLYGKKVGLAFQVWDDVLDVEGDEAVLGKHVGADQELEKSTYVALLGLDGAKDYAHSLIVDAVEALDRVSVKSHLLKDFASFCIQRDH